jgi:hypothetical protein
LLEKPRGRGRNAGGAAGTRGGAAGTQGGGRAASHGDGYAVTPAPRAGSTDGGVLPKFRCFPDPFGSGVFEKTATGEEVMCPCYGV